MALTAISGETQAQPLNDNFSYLNEKIIDIGYNIKDYGAVGNGITDDTTSFSNAINDLNDTGGKLIIPSGIYLISSALPTITKNGSHIKGSGLTATTISYTHTTSNLFTVGSETASVTVECSFSDFTISHIASRADGYTFTFVNAQKYTVSNIVLSNAYHIFQLGSITDVSSNFAVIKDLIGNCKGIAFDLKGGVNGIHILEVQINSEYIYTGSTAISFPQTANLDTIYIDNCLFQRFAYGFLLNGTSGIIQNAFITNSVIDGTNNYSLYFNPSSTQIITRFEFTSCWFTSINEDCCVIGCAATAIVDGLYFNSCRFLLASKRCIIIQSQYAINCDFDNCIISGASQTANNTYSAFVTDTSCKKFSITNCTIGDEGQTTLRQKYGIELAGDNDYYEISNNWLIGNVTGAISDTILGTFNTKLIQSNLGYNPVGVYTPPAIPASSVAQSNTFSTVVEVYIYGGTVTQIQKNGQGIAGMTSGVVLLYPNETVTIVYSVAPSWTWFGL